MATKTKPKTNTRNPTNTRNQTNAEATSGSRRPDRPCPQPDTDHRTVGVPGPRGIPDVQPPPTHTNPTLPHDPTDTN